MSRMQKYSTQKEDHCTVFVNDDPLFLRYLAEILNLRGILIPKILDKDNIMTKPEIDPGHPLPFLQNGIAQVAILVEDLEKTVENYWILFGIGPWHFYTYAKPLVGQMSYHGQPADYQMRIALSQIGPMRIELIEAKEGDSIYTDFIKEHGYGVHHLGILVEDMNDALAQAHSAGFNMIQDGSGFGLDGDGHYAYLETEGLLGVTLELIQRPKARVQPEKIYPPDTVSS